jgi:amino-acid N-acetyltransferase
MNIRAATKRDVAIALELLQQAGLPTADLTSNNLALVAEDSSGTLGIIGLEEFGGVGLLRSLVVRPSARGRGIGQSLATALERLAHGRGISEMWLLTMDADEFFAGLGFRPRNREDAPDAIRGSEEFSNLCPANAVLMSKATFAD